MIGSLSDKKFRDIRRLTSMFKFALDQIQDIRTEHDTARDTLFNSLLDLEKWLEEKHGVQIELCHLINGADFLTDERVKFYRKKILDHGGELKREIENERE